MGATTARPWLAKLTLAQLHQVAVSIGAPCSGTKAARVAGIQEAVGQSLSGTPAGKQTTDDGGDLSLLSIDMGIRNLAFAHISAPLWSKSKSNSRSCLQKKYGVPMLQQWRQVAVSQSHIPTASTSTSSSSMTSGKLLQQQQQQAKESFEPVDYAHHAYHLITHLLHTYRPTHILIERQRFRTAGRAAVPEWTIRVGVFEGMLYAVLRTLVEQGHVKVHVEPVQPAFVNRYWFEFHRQDQTKTQSQSQSPSSLLPPPPVSTAPGAETSTEEIATSRSRRSSGREVKKAKIDLVGQMLVDGDGAAKYPTLLINEALRPFISDFISIWRKEIKKDMRKSDKNDDKSKSKSKSKSNKKSTAIATDIVDGIVNANDNTNVNAISKLDDLADCLLQGLAWIEWQNRRRNIHLRGRDGMDNNEERKSGELS